MLIEKKGFVSLFHNPIHHLITHMGYLEITYNPYAIYYNYN